MELSGRVLRAGCEVGGNEVVKDNKDNKMYM